MDVARRWRAGLDVPEGAVAPEHGERREVLVEVLLLRHRGEEAHHEIRREVGRAPGPVALRSTGDVEPQLLLQELALLREARLRRAVVSEDRAEHVWHRAGVQILAHLERDLHLLGERRRHVLGHHVGIGVRRRQRLEIRLGRGCWESRPHSLLLECLHQSHLREAAGLRNRVAEEDGLLPRRHRAGHRHRVRPIRVLHVRRPADVRLGVRARRGSLVDEAHVRGGGRDGERDRRSCLGARRDHHVHQVVVHDDRRDDDTGAQLALTFREERGIDQHPSTDLPDAMRTHLGGDVADHQERITRHGLRVGACIVRVVLVLEGERAILLDASRQIRIAARHQNQIAIERPVAADRPRSIDAGVKTIVRTEETERAPHSEQLGGGAGDEELVTIERVDLLPRIERVEFHPPVGVPELGPVDDALHPLRERRIAGPLRCLRPHRQRPESDDRRQHRRASAPRRRRPLSNRQR